ncbi:hypothetical protein RGQ29_017354 [Quercus rubra]|uniref:XS domain-containing protein n=1 Tax=Quercus rubra TaxID=3512 RepID=A0AAN7FLH5_QUERU|nr:hypothetical protein RGQ29_017354 [Quercus rubra]
MQSRRREDYITLSPASKLRGQHRLEMGSDYPYNGARHDALDRSPRRVALDRSPRARRSMSPHRLDGSRRVAGGSRRSRSIERREYHQWHLSGSNGGRGDQIRSRSPPFEQVRKRVQFDDDSLVMHRNYAPPMELRRGYELCDHADFKVDDDNMKSKHVLLYEHNSSRIGKERDFSESRLAAGGGHGMLAQKSMALEDGIAHGSYRLTQDLGPTDYRETDGHLSSSSRSIDIRRFEHERPQYQDAIAMDKLPIMDSYKDGEKPMFQSRDMPYPIVSASHSKGFAGTSPLADLSSSSSRMLRSEFLGSYRDDMHLPPPSGEFSRSSGKLADPLGFNAYEERPLIDSSGEPEAGQRNLTYYQRGACSPTRAECEDYPYPKLYGIANDDRGYPSDDLYRMMPPQVPLDYDHARSDYDHRDLPRPNIMHHAVNRVDNITEDSYRNPRKGTLLDHSTLHKQTVSEYLDTNRMSNASKQGGEYLGSRRSQVEFERRLSPEYETSHLGASQDRQILNMRADFGFGKDAGPKFLKERLQSPPVSKYDLDGHRHSVRMQRMDEHGLSEPSDRMLKRKFSFKEELSGHDSRKIMSNKWNASRGLQDRYDSGEEWIDEDMSALYSSNSVGLDRNEYRKPKRIYDRLEYRQDFASDNWVSSQDSLSQTQRHSVGLYKHGGRYTRAHPRTGFLSSHNLHHFDRRSGLQKLQSNVWKRNDDYHEDEQEDDGDPSEDWVNPLESEPSEDSEEFKQLVQEAFLKYCKKLNVNPAVRRRYKEQGKAGSFFCIVCGKSYSKEFLDTQRLVTHAFMSHKVGLRSQHLGLHKAICVLLGWNTVVPEDTITWSPEVLPNAEALAQKEDLILWPPLIVVHNISMSDSNPRKWKVVKVEEVETFLREKGFIRGRIKVCLGRPSDKSVMVIKFLGTFTGLGDAEKLHKYFDENKRGRVDFERITSNNGKSSKSWDAGNQGEKVEEHILYGYMGIAEDLDKVDYNTRKSCVIKSKMEIQDLANAPLRPDER